MYSIELYYGYEVTSYGTNHAFIVADPEDDVTQSKDVGNELMEELDIDPDEPSEDFNYDVTTLALPKSLIKRIQAEAVEDYILKMNQKEAESNV